MWGVGEVDELFDLVCDRWRYIYFIGFSWEEVLDEYLNIIFLDFFSESLEYIFGRSYERGIVINVDCCGY